MTDKQQPAFPTQQSIREAYKARLDQVLDSALAEFNPDRALDAATRKLAESRQQAVWNLLGLTDKWGKWEYDSHRKDSPLANWLASEVSAKLYDFMNELILSELDNVKAALKKRIKSQMTSAVVDHLEWNTRHKAEEAAKDIADECIREATAELLKEINPEN